MQNFATSQHNGEFSKAEFKKIIFFFELMLSDKEHKSSKLRINLLLKNIKGNSPEHNFRNGKKSSLTNTDILLKGIKDLTLELTLC